MPSWRRFGAIIPKRQCCSPSASSPPLPTSAAWRMVGKQWKKNVTDNKLTASFWKRIDKRGPDECWLWKGPKTDAGHGFFYGALCIDGKPWRAHRLMWTLANGPIPPKMHICHHCDVPLCCNPAHLFLGTNADNMADRNSKQRQARGEKQALAKLTEESVSFIRSTYSRGDKQSGVKPLARRFGVTPRTIRDVVRGVTWAAQPFPQEKT